ncbi:MAG: hypothetical protein QM777_07140 [Pseudorhodoferax sp.]
MASSSMWCWATRSACSRARRPARSAGCSSNPGPGSRNWSNWPRPRAWTPPRWPRSGTAASSSTWSWARPWGAARCRGCSPAFPIGLDDTLVGALFMLEAAHQPPADSSYAAWLACQPERQVRR